MSSSRPTDVAPPRPARWSPAGWPLRTRLIAIMVGLLVLLGLVVGGTAEIYLHKTLNERVNDQLGEASRRALGGPGHGSENGRPSRYFANPIPPPGFQSDWITAGLTQSGTGVEVAGGGIVRYLQGDAETDSAKGPRNEFVDLPADAVNRLATVIPDGNPADVDLGGALGDYRAIATVLDDRTMVVTALPLKETQTTLLQIAAVTGGTVLVTLLVAGWAGAAIIRRTLLPLNRVAATATRVSELQLDRGEVKLAQRVPAADTDPRTEVGQVGSALNRLLDHVGDALESRHASEQQVRQFVADASHELRTPLAAIRGYAELTRRSRQPVPEEIAHMLCRIESQTHRMTTLVEDLLLLARLDAGRPLAHEPVDLTMLVVDAVSDAHAAGPRHDWRLDLPEEPVTITGDGQRLQQVLANLLTNARTHTPEGTTVTVGVGQDDRAALLTVTDEGPGIPADLQPHVFERFARGDGSRSRAAGSTGLGLSIVHAVVTAHGGTVSVRSVPGRTEFTVRLPAATAPQHPEPLPVGR